MTIAFDEGVADALINVATTSASALRAEGSSRRASAENAAQDFSGGYARLFTAACSTESQDRVRLAGVLSNLASDVRAAKVKAQAEKKRLAELDAWRERDANRLRFPQIEMADSGPPTTFPRDWPSEPFDPKPSDLPIPPPTISVAFSATRRQRETSPSSAGTTSAVPARLRDFVTQARGSNHSLASEATRVHNAWSGFKSSCSWVNFGSSTFVTGFTDFLVENESDVAWIRHVAGAFEKAGAEGLSGSQLDVSWKARLDSGEDLGLVDSLLQSLIGIVKPPGGAAENTAWTMGSIGTMGVTTAEMVAHLKVGRLAPRGSNGRFVKVATDLSVRGRQALTPGNWVAKPYAAGARAKWLTTGKWVGRAGTVLGFASGGIDQWNRDDGAGYELDERIGRAATRAVASGSGAWAGAAVGVKAGAFLGSFAGPVGTVVGGLLGGLVGGAIGSGIGDLIADKVVDGVGEVADKVGDGLKSLGDTLTFWD